LGTTRPSGDVLGAVFAKRTPPAKDLFPMVYTDFAERTQNGFVFSNVRRFDFGRLRNGTFSPLCRYGADEGAAKTCGLRSDRADICTVHADRYSEESKQAQASYFVNFRICYCHVGSF
jgi:hypothetical protein